jgi:DNA-binding transcriptional regulator YiaG
VPKAENAGFYRTPKELKDALSRLKIKRDGIQQVIDHLDRRKTETVAGLKEMGVASSADYQRDDKVKLSVKLLQSLVTQINRLEADIVRYDQAIIRIEASLKDLEIKQLSEGVGLSDDDFIKLSTTIHDLDDQMGLDSSNLLDELSMKQLLDEELKKFEKSNTKKTDKTDEAAEIDKPAADGATKVTPKATAQE